MRILTNLQFRRFANDHAITNEALCKAVREVSTGLAHANLGGGVFKQRIARRGQGKSGGFRTIIFFRARHVAFFILGFAKNAQDNLRKDEVAGLKDLAERMLNYDEKTIDLALRNGAFEEIFCEPQIP